MRSDLTQSNSTSSLSVSHSTHDKQAKAKSPAKRQPQRPRTAEREGAVKRLRARYPELDRLYQREGELEELVAKKRWVAVPDLGPRHPDDARTEKFFPHYRPLKTRLVIDGQEELEKVREAIQLEIFMEICKSPLMPSGKQRAVGQAASVSERAVPPTIRARSSKVASTTTPKAPKAATSSHGRKISIAPGVATTMSGVVPRTRERAAREARTTSSQPSRAPCAPERTGGRDVKNAAVVVPHAVTLPPGGNDSLQPDSRASSAAAREGTRERPSSHRSSSSHSKRLSSGSGSATKTLSKIQEKRSSTRLPQGEAHGSDAPTGHQSGTASSVEHSHDSDSDRVREREEARSLERDENRRELRKILGKLKVPSTITLNWNPGKIFRIPIKIGSFLQPASRTSSNVEAKLIDAHWCFHMQAALQLLADCYGKFVELYAENPTVTNGPLGFTLGEEGAGAIQRADAAIRSKLTPDEEELFFSCCAGTTHINSLQEMFAFDPDEYKDLFDQSGRVHAYLSRDKVADILQAHIVSQKKRMEALYDEYWDRK